MLANSLATGPAELDRLNRGRQLPRTAQKVISLIGRWTDLTRPIVRLDLLNRMVTKGYQKGVYEWVTKGIRRGVPPEPRKLAL